MSSAFTPAAFARNATKRGVSGQALRLAPASFVVGVEYESAHQLAAGENTPFSPAEDMFSVFSRNSLVDGFIDDFGAVDLHANPTDDSQIAVGEPSLVRLESNDSFDFASASGDSPDTSPFASSESDSEARAWFVQFAQREKQLRASKHNLQHELATDWANACQVPVNSIKSQVPQSAPIAIPRKLTGRTARHSSEPVMRYESPEQPLHLVHLDDFTPTKSKTEPEQFCVFMSDFEL